MTWRHVRAIALLPGMVVVVIPVVILLRSDSVEVGWGLPPGLAWLPVLLGAALLVAGAALWYGCVSLFARVGKGTLAPWDPTQHLVIEGPYRLVRNPMISGVLAVLLGQAALLGSLPLLVWFLVFFAINAVFIPLFEEPGVARRFGEEWERYRRRVPRWIPRGRAPR